MNMNNETMENLKFVMMNSNYRNQKHDPVFVPIGLAVFSQLKFGKTEAFLDLYDKISYTNDEHYKNLEMQTLDISGKYIPPEVNPKTDEPADWKDKDTDLCQIKIFEILIRLKEIIEEKNCNIVLYDLDMWQGSPDPEIIHCEVKYFIEV